MTINLEITFAGSKINAAGITEAQLTTLSNLVGVIGEGKVNEKLQTRLRNQLYI
jgi:hypothetical protein